MCRLRSYDANPPGNFSYVQTEGIYRAFPAQPLIEAEAQTVSAFRKGNGLPRAGLAECLQDVDRYTAQRLGCNPTYCVSLDSQGQVTMALSQASPILSPCGGCGARVI